MQLTPGVTDSVDGVGRWLWGIVEMLPSDTLEGPAEAAQRA